MTIDERSRHALHQRLEQLLGPDEAGTLMEYLPPLGWADVATRRDLALLHGDVDGVRRDVDRVRRDLEATRTFLIGTFRSELAQAVSSQTRTLLLVNLGSMIGVGALVLAAVKL